jgi:hypothetical protein
VAYAKVMASVDQSRIPLTGALDAGASRKHLHLIQGGLGEPTTLTSLHPDT